MLRDMIKKLGPDFGFLKESDDAAQKETEQDVINKLDRSVKMDEVDTVTFGLETDDGKIVKVYVNADQANDFERALADKLGEIDDIEEALNELSKEYEIVDVEWPEDTSSDEEVEGEESTDGSEVLDSKVYKSKGKDSQAEDPMESLNMGEKFTMMLESDATTIEGRLNTAAQLMVYHAILELGIPEIALNRNPYRAAIVKGIRQKAFELNRNSQMKIALKMFVKRSSDYDTNTKDEDPSKAKQQNESIELMEGLSQEFWTGFQAIIKYISPDQKLSEAFLTSSRMDQLMARSNSILTSRIPQQLRSRLNDLIEELNKTPNAAVTESATPDEITGLLSSMIRMADPSDDGRQAKIITTGSQWNQLMAKVKVGLSTKFTGGTRTKLNLLKQSVENAIALLNKKAEPTVTAPVAESKKLNEEKQDWEFEKDSEDLTISCKLVSLTLDPEETEKLIKGVSNRDAIVVKDVDGSKKFVFSPRGVNGVIKQVGQTQTYNISAKDIESLLDTAAQSSKEEPEEDDSKDKEATKDK